MHRLRHFLLPLATLFALLPNPAVAESLVVVVNPECGIETLSRSDVINIFLGRFRQLPSGITAQPIDLPVSAARAQFYRALVNKEPAEFNAYWARLVFSGRTSPPIQTERQEDVIKALRANPGGIAYLERSKVSSREKIVFEVAP
jgi:ABC-type phosphate transport system substrate-binding protein